MLQTNVNTRGGGLLLQDNQSSITGETCTVPLPSLGLMVKHHDICPDERHRQPKTERPTTPEPTFSISDILTARKLTLAKPIPCPRCEKTFSRISSLKEHQHIHEGKKSYSCPYCDKQFFQSINRKVHLTAHTQAHPFKCLYCPIVFSQFSKLSEHLQKTHAQEVLNTREAARNKKQQRIPCQFCGKKFFYYYLIRAHLRTHTGERPYKCSYCDKSFKQTSNLKTHEMRHTVKKTYACSW